MDIRLHPLSLALLTILLWGLWGFFGKLALERKMAPAAIFLCEVFISAACAAGLLIVLWLKGGGRSATGSWNVYGVVSGAALAVGLLFYYLALGKTDASVIVPVTALYPAVTVLMSYGLLGERPTPWQWAGIVLAIAGAVLLLTAPGKPHP